MRKVQKISTEGSKLLLVEGVFWVLEWEGTIGFARKMIWERGEKRKRMKMKRKKTGVLAEMKREKMLLKMEEEEEEDVGVGVGVVADRLLRLKGRRLLKGNPFENLTRTNACLGY